MRTNLDEARSIWIGKQEGNEILSVRRRERGGRE